jgi:type II secretory pathway component PulJ
MKRLALEDNLYVGRGGYTLVEISISLMLTMIVGALALGTFTLVSRSFNSWQKRLAQENTVHLVLMRAAQDLRQAHSVQQTESGFVLLRESEEIVYTSHGGVLQRNGSPIAGPHAMDLFLDMRERTPSSRTVGSIFELTLTSVREQDTTSTTLMLGLRRNVEWTTQSEL